jgi:hypothetical protein
MKGTINMVSAMIDKVRKKISQPSLREDRSDCSYHEERLSGLSAREQIAYRKKKRNLDALLAKHTDIPEELRPVLVLDMLARIAEAEGRPTDLTTRFSGPDSRPALALPEKAPEGWADRPSRKSEDPVAFIERVYAPWLSKGLTRADILRLDRPLYMAFTKWVDRHGMPEDLDLPTRSQLVDRRIAKYGRPSYSEVLPSDPEAREKLQLRNTLGSRSARQAYKKG